MNLFNLAAKLFLDASDYKQGLKDAEKESSSFSSKVGTVMKGATKAFTAVTATVGTVASSVVALGVKMVDLGGEIDDNAQRLGLSTEQYQLWQFAMTKAGTDVSTLQRGMIQLSNWTEKLSEGQADALVTLDKLGIGYEEFMALDNAGQLEAITNALQGMENQTEKANLASELFGDRVSQQLMPLFNEEQGSIAELNEQLREQGVIVGDENVQAAAKLGDKIDLLKSTLTSFGLKLATDVFPEIGQLIDGFQGLVTGSDNASKGIATAIVGIVDKVVNELPAVIAKVVAFAKELVTGVIAILPEVSNTLLNAIFDLIDMLATNAPSIITTLFTLVFNIVKALFNANNLVRFIEVFTDLLLAITESISTELPALVAAIIDDIVKLFTTKEGLAKLGKIGLAIAQAIVNMLISGVETGINRVIDGVNVIFKNLSKAWTWAGIPAIEDLEKITLQRVKLYAKGGMFDDITKFAKGTMYAVAGENGAEIVASGTRGTGVANVEQISDAQYMALKDYGLNETIMKAASGIVNGIVSGLGMRGSDGSSNIVVQIGGKEFKNYIVKIINEVLNSQGRKNLKTITAY